MPEDMLIAFGSKYMSHKTLRADRKNQIDLTSTGTLPQHLTGDYFLVTA